MGGGMATIFFIKLPKKRFVLRVNYGKSVTDWSNQGIVFPPRLFVGPADFSMHGAEVRIDLGIALVPVPPAPSHEEARFASLFPYGCAKSFRRSMKALGVLSSQSWFLALVLNHDEIPSG